MTDDFLDIPDFLRRAPADAPLPAAKPYRRREKKIPYPKDGYKCVGARAETRAAHKARLARKAERMRKRKR
jgi:hypothetical protein